jgi:hypothetical protein
VRFALINEAKEEFPVHRLCHVLGVSQGGYFAWKGRPACRRQHEDMVLLAHVRSAFALSHGTYGSPRMTRELQDSGLAVGRRRTARLMRENGLRARQRRRISSVRYRARAARIGEAGGGVDRFLSGWGWLGALDGVRGLRFGRGD